MNSTAASLNSKPPRSTDAAAELRALKVEKLRRLQLRAESLGDFIPRVSPGMVRPHHLAPVLALFERIRRGERVRVCLSVPSQHGKSETVLHALAWLLSSRPTWPLIYLTYQQDQSDDQSHKARDIARRANVALSPDRQNLRMWRTALGGGCLFTSVDGPGAGQPAKVAVVDDPYKNREKALSAAVRRAVKSAFTSVVLQRGQEDMSVVVVHTRWLEDDLIGNIARGEFGDDWEVINLPMLGVEDADGKVVPAPRPYDTATRVLNPRRLLPDGRAFGWTLAGAQKFLRELPEHDAESMAQGRPRRRVDGALWSWEHLTPWRRDEAPPLSRTIVAVDPNASDEAAAAKADDAGVVTLARGADGRAYVLADASGKMGVDGWAARAVAAFRRLDASAIVAEANNGGAMVERTIRAYLLTEALRLGHREPDPVTVKLVKVKGDKRGRAESARDLYGDPATGTPSMVSHVGHHPRLEESMTTHDFATTSRSPGDLDALSLGLADLVLSPVDEPQWSDADYDF